MRDTVQLEFSLNARPPETFLRKVTDGTYRADRLGLNVEVGKRILEVLEDMRYPIGAKESIQTYPCGMANGRESMQQFVDGLAAWEKPFAIHEMEETIRVRGRGKTAIRTRGALRTRGSAVQEHSEDLIVDRFRKGLAAWERQFVANR